MSLRQTPLSVKLALLCMACASPMSAHVAQQSFVLLLPTETYTAAGVATVALTVLVLAVLPKSGMDPVFQARACSLPDAKPIQNLTSLVTLCGALFAVYVGLFGPRDPLSNLMPLGFWALGWVAMVSLCGIFGNLWTWLNPWTGLLHMIGPRHPKFLIPAGLGQWPAVLLLIAFSAYLLAGIAPDDPAQLARLAAAYGLATCAGLWLFGQAWMRQVELGHAVMATYGALSVVRLGPSGGFGGPGWQSVEHAPMRAAGVFALTLLAAGSFDGLNETFWWLGVIGENPLEFPGRSAVVSQTILGLLVTIAGLAALFALTTWTGLRLAKADTGFGRAYDWLALGLVPIALAYHIAHYLPSFLVAVQYCIAALSDPFASGADWLGIQPFYVTTGFFNRMDTVRIIWLTQAGVVVFGHVWSVLLSHAIAMRIVGSSRRAVWLTLPLSALMIGYTLLGLWLLAAPRGA